MYYYDWMIEIVSMTDEYCVAKNIQDSSNRKSREIGRYWPSEASVEYINECGVRSVVGKCARAIWYSIHNIEQTNPPDAVGLRKMGAGRIIEAEERRIGEEMGIVVRDNDIPDEFRCEGMGPRRFIKHISDEIRISGEIDMLYKVDGKYYIGELKSGYGYMFNRDIITKGQPKKEHLMQIALYLDTFKQVEQGILLYIDRGEAEKRQFIIQVLPNGIITVDGEAESIVTLNGILSRLDYVHYHSKENAPPTGDFTGFYSDQTIESYHKAGIISKTKYNNYKKGRCGFLGDFQCMYCSYKQLCINEQGMRKDI